MICLKKTTNLILVLTLLSSIDASAFSSSPSYLSECKKEIENAVEYEALTFKFNYSDFKFSSLEIDKTVPCGKIATFSSKTINISVFYQGEKCYIYDTSTWY